MKYYLFLSDDIAQTCLFKYIENFTSKSWKFSDKKFFYFSYSAQNTDWGSSNEYPQSMFQAEIRKIMHTTVNPSFTI